MSTFSRTAAATIAASILSAGLVPAMGTSAHGAEGVATAQRFTTSANILDNGRFDRGTEGWAKRSAHRASFTVNNSGRHGSNAARITPVRRATNIVLTDNPNATANADQGDVYLATAHVRTNRPRVYGNLTVRELDNGSTVERNIKNFRLTTRAWVKVTTLVTATADDSTLDLRIRTPRLTKGQSLIVDNVTLAPVVLTETTPEPIVTPEPVPTPEPTPAVTPVPEPTPVAEPKAPASAPFLFGMGGGNVDPAAAETRLGNKLEIRRIYHSKGAKVDNVLRLVADDIAKGREASEISFKVPLSWPEMAAGEGDYFFTEVATKLRATVAGTDHRVMLAFNHEPEDDFKSATAAEQDRQRDAWKAMQNRAAGFFADNDNVEYGVIYMGYHSFPNLGSALYPRWSLANATPATAELDYIGLDVYEDATAPAKFRPFETRYFKPMQAFAAQRGVEWGLSETGLTEEAFNARPTWFTDMAALLKKYDASFFDYFNTNLNSIAGWAMIAGDNREKGFAAALRNERATP